MADFSQLNNLSVQNNKVVLATCNLNQWALDFDGNLSRVLESIRIAKMRGAKYRLGPELELSGYSCEDHFLELDTFIHCEQSLASILQSGETDGMLCDIGTPMLFNNVRYNCRVLCLDGKILLIRPKVCLADDGNYREKRFFTPWDHTNRQLVDYPLSDLLRSITGQQVVPMGLGVIRTQETVLGFEMCEELWSVNSPHLEMYLSGVEIVSNGSGSHHVLRKLDSRLSLMRNATRKAGGVYMYSNHRGCDGNRLYFDGSSMICVNGNIVSQATQFSLNDVEVITAVVDLYSIKSYRMTVASNQEQSSRIKMLPAIDLSHFSLRNSCQFSSSDPNETGIKDTRIHKPEEECCLGPACWLWDYLRRSGAAGFLLPLSGGADSSSVAAIVRVMCATAANAARYRNFQVIADILKLLSRSGLSRNNSAAISALLDELSAMEKSKTSQGTDSTIPSTVFAVTPAAAAGLTSGTITNESSPEESSNEAVLDEDLTLQLADEISNHVLHTIYLGTENSSFNTKDRARRLAGSIQSYHSTIIIDDIVRAVLKVFSTFSGGKMPRYESQGGTPAEDLALQNIQARLRMVMSYLCAQLFPWLRGNKGFLLVLGSANVDEALRGYMTKYDCSSADINPIGGMSKGDLKRMMLWVAENYQLPVLSEVALAAPTAELRPIESDGEGEKLDPTQTDEEDMGMTYAELGVFGYVRKVLKCGPVRMFLRLVEMWKHITAREVAVKVKRFFFFYSINRHKLTTLTPAYHAEDYSPDDNRFDLRQFLYNSKWTRQFNNIDSIVASLKSE